MSVYVFNPECAVNPVKNKIGEVEKAKPVDTRGRKATDPLWKAGLPTDEGAPAFFWVAALVMKIDVSFNPGYISLFGPDRIMFQSNKVSFGNSNPLKPNQGDSPK